MSDATNRTDVPDFRNYGPPANVSNWVPIPPPMMTLRDWFAGQVLSGVSAALITSSGSAKESTVAKECYRLADAMLRERAK